MKSNRPILSFLLKTTNPFTSLGSFVFLQSERPEGGGKRHVTRSVAADSALNELSQAPVEMAPRHVPTENAARGRGDGELGKSRKPVNAAKRANWWERPALPDYCLSSSERRSRTRARAHRFFTLSTLRPILRATSGKVSDSRCRMMMTSR